METHIVIAGGGFGGISAALALAKQTSGASTKITLIDRNPHHVIQAYLYELATSSEELTDMAHLKQSVAIPMTEIFRGTNIVFQQATIQSIDPIKKQITHDQGIASYDYLILGLGSTSNFYNIPGAEQYALPMKTVSDSLLIRNQIAVMLDTHRLDPHKQNMRVVIAGGGFTGVEIAAELRGLLDFLAWEKNYPREKLHVTVVEGTNQVMPGMDKRLAQDVYARLKDLGTEIQLGAMIINVEQNFLTLDNGERLEYDCLVWTAGVKANKAPFVTPVALDKGQHISVNGMFQMQEHENTFVIGDQTCFMDNEGRPLPGTSSQAIEQGKYVGYALAKILQGQQPQPFSCRNLGFIISLGGTWAILTSPRFYLKGYLPYVIRQFVWFKYFWSIIGFWKALKLSLLENKLYSRND